METEYQISMIKQLHKTYAGKSPQLLEDLRERARTNRNIFKGIMEASKHCSIGQITQALFEVGGQYRRNM